MKSSLEGAFHLAHDGVLQSYDGNGRMIGYRQLNPEQITSYLGMMPDQSAMRPGEWEGVDGRAVRRERAVGSAGGFEASLASKAGGGC